MPYSKIMGLLGICRKAGCLLPGFTRTKEAVESGRAACVIVSSDAGDSLKKISACCERHHVPLLSLPLRAFELSSITGRQTAVAAVTDSGFAESLMRRVRDGEL